MQAVDLDPRVHRFRGNGRAAQPVSYTHLDVYKRQERTHLTRVATYGYRREIRKDRDDSPTGILKETSTKYPTEAFSATQIRLAEALRKLNVERPAGSKPVSYTHLFGTGGKQSGDD